MADDRSTRRPSRPAAFWRSLPGVLTGIAAVIAAVGTLGAVFKGGGEDHASTTSVPGAVAAAPTSDATAVASTALVSSVDVEGAAQARKGCFGDVFAGIPVNRLGPVEVGTDAYDIVEPSEPQAGPVGLRFTDGGRTVGAAKVTWIPVNGVFRVNAVVDARCRPVADYAPTVDPGQRNVMKASDGLRVHLAGRMYLLRLDAGANGVRVGFLQTQT